MSRQRITVLTCVLGLLSVSSGYAAPGPNGVLPFDDSGMVLPTDRPAGLPNAPAGGPGLQAGADHIVAQQCPDDGFGWPHNDCSATYHNITAPILTGVLKAYDTTGDAAHLASVVAGADFDLLSQYPTGETRFGTMTPLFMWEVSMATGDMTYQTFAEVEFFDALSAGTYGQGPYDTAGFIALVQAARQGQWINLLPWEFSTLIHTATAIGNPGQDALFLGGVLDGLNTLDNANPGSVWTDLLGVAGGVRGLALSGTTTFVAINSPLHSGINGIDNLEDLAAYLASQQNLDGSWYWHSNLAAPDVSDEDTQTSAYAVMALAAADPLTTASYATAIADGNAWLLSMQQMDGGFQSYPGGTENTEVEGEALTALTMVGAPVGVPTVSQWGLIIMTLIGFVAAGVLYRRRRAVTA